MNMAQADNGNEIIAVTVKCYKPNTDLMQLALLLDSVLRQQGYDVRDVVTRIVEENDANSPEGGHSPG